MTVRHYKTNLNCGSCVAAVKPLLDGEPSIQRWEVDTSNPSKRLTVEGDAVATATVERLVTAAGFRVLGEMNGAKPNSPPASSAETPAAEPPRKTLGAYYPLLLVVAYLIGTVAIVEFRGGEFLWHRAMNVFMGAFFLAFSFFKLLDLRGFASAFQSYDILARRSLAYAYAYPFIELLLGIAYATGVLPLATNLVTLAVMLLGLAGVTQSLLAKRQIKCACLGTVFNLPMSIVTFVEDAAMAGMAGVMLFWLLAQRWVI
jgi:hypothetical protein